MDDFEKEGRTQHTAAEEVRRNWTGDPRGHLTIQNRNTCVKRDLRDQGGSAGRCARNPA